MMAAVASPLTGRIVSLDEVNDEVFSERVMGDGVAVMPQSSEVVAPVAGRLEKLFDGGHGFAIETPNGVQVLVHIGLETVHLRGEGFEAHAVQGDEVDVGDLIVTVDLSRMSEKGVDMVSPVVVISGHKVEMAASGSVQVGDPLMEVN
jgi:glucose-specific phosphotransferase system IIA component